MNRVLALIALAASGCDRQPEQSAAPQRPAAPLDISVEQAPSSKPPATIPMPEDKAEVDRMIVAGYTPHGKHLHAPGVKECPLAQGGEAVM